MSFMLSVTYAENHHAQHTELHYGECRGATETFMQGSSIPIPLMFVVGVYRLNVLQFVSMTVH